MTSPRFDTSASSGTIGRVISGSPAPSTIADASLVEMIRDGRDRAAAETELSARFRRRAYLYGVKHLRSHADADDLAHDVLTTVIERLRAGAMADPEKLGSFVLGVCRLLVLDRQRSHSRKAKILARFATALPAEAEVSNAQEVESTHLARVRDCLAALADRDRTVLLLSFYAELDGEAVGREIGVEQSHVRVIRHRALGRLRTCVKGVREDEP